MGQSKKMLLSYDDPTLLTGKQASYHTQERNPEFPIPRKSLGNIPKDFWPLGCCIYLKKC